MFNITRFNPIDDAFDSLIRGVPVWLPNPERREAAPPWRMQDLPEAYVQSMLNGIVGIEIRVTRLEGKFKLSQNRPVADRPRIIAALEGRDDADSQAVARLMRQREPTG